MRDRLVMTTPHHLLGVKAGVPYQVVGVITPVESFILRVSGGGADRVVRKLETVYTKEKPSDWVDVDFEQPHDNYLVGACLPVAPCYSPVLDFHCVWGVDPVEEWKNAALPPPARRIFHCSQPYAGLCFW